MKICTSCDSNGRVRSFDEVVVRFNTTEKFKLVDKTEAPDDWFRTLKGEVVRNDQQERIDAIPAISGAVDEKVKDMLEASHHVDECDTRILLQNLRIERVPVAEVRYSYAGVARSLWVCGEEQKVHAPNAPWRSGRLWGILGGVAAGVLVLITVIVFLASR